MTSYIYNKYVLKRNFEKSILPFAEKNNNTIFILDKITLFSNCNAKNKNLSNSNFTIENLYQYTDIALFINTPDSEKNKENTLKKVWINNLNYLHTPEIGNQNLYYKNINDFSKSDLISTNKLEDSLDFEITSESEIDLSNPVLYNNLANPITLSYINENVKTDYTITDTSSPITYDGSLLKKCNISLNSINCGFSFDIHIINNLDQEFKSTVFIDIPLETTDKTIYDGSIIKKLETNYIFYRYK